MAQPAVLNLDMDFFTSPPYFGRYYRDVEATSYSTYHSTSSIWLSSEQFKEKLNLQFHVRGASMRDDNQNFFYIKKMIDEEVLIPQKFTIVNFDSHHDAYVHWDEKHYRSIDGKFHNYDNMIAPFIHEWINEIIWVIPDYMTQEMIQEQFKFMRTSITKDIIQIQISSSLFIRLRIIKWSEFQSNQFDWKFFNLILNPEMSKSTPQMVQDMKSLISVH